jgi:hypothetical protein
MSLNDNKLSEIPRWIYRPVLCQRLLLLNISVDVTLSLNDNKPSETINIGYTCIVLLLWLYLLLGE